jgi:hypothetical protein
MVTHPYVTVTGTIEGANEFRRAWGSDIMPFMQSNVKKMFRITKRHALKIIRTGDGMSPNRGRYAMQKQMGNEGASATFIGGRLSHLRRYGMPYKQSDRAPYTSFVDPGTRFNALGVLSGQLYNGVKNQQMGGISQYDIGIKDRISPKTKRVLGFDIKFQDVDISITTSFRDPEYIGYVHFGKPGVVARPFFDVACSRAERQIAAAFEANWKRADALVPESVHAAWQIDEDSREFGGMEVDRTYLSKRAIRRIPREQVSLTWWRRD